MAMVLSRGAFRVGQLAAYRAMKYRGMGINTRAVRRARNIFQASRMAYRASRAIPIQRLYRRYRSRKVARAKRANFSTTNIGEPKNSGDAKRNIAVNDNGLIALATRTQLVTELTSIPEGSGINQRERRLVNVSGFKICMEMRNDLEGPLYINVAVLSPKDGASTVTSDDFFRGSGTDRGRNFNSATLDSNEYHCLPINVDRYTVLRHTRYTLASNRTSTVFDDYHGRNYTNIDWWVPLKRQVRYDAASGLPESGRVFLVMWCDQWGANAAAGSVAAAMSYSRKITTYFKEPKN